MVSSSVTNTNAVRNTPASSSLYDVLDLILDKGLVVDAYVRVSLVGVELLTVDARIVVASVDTYLRFAEAANRLDLKHQDDSTSLPEIVGAGNGSGGGLKKEAAKSALSAVGDWLGGSEEKDQESAQGGGEQGQGRQQQEQD
jgi:hypothetical protein